METKNVNFLSIVLKNGLLLGLASVAFNVVLYVTDLLYTDSTLMGILTWLVATAISNEGFLSIGEAIKVGVVVAVIAGVIGAIYQVIYTTIIDPDYYEKVVEVTMKKMSGITSNFTEEQMEEFQDKMYANKPSIVSSFSTSIIFSAIGGLIISAIVGAVKKKEQPMPL